MDSADKLVSRRIVPVLSGVGFHATSLRQVLHLQIAPRPFGAAATLQHIQKLLRMEVPQTGLNWRGPWFVIERAKSRRFAHNGKSLFVDGP